MERGYAATVQYLGDSSIVTAKVLRIAVPSPLNRVFDYLPPVDWVPEIPLSPGMRVRVPFGRTHQVGVLLELRQDSHLPIESLRPALEILDSEPLLSSDQLGLACWAQRYYHHPPGEVFAAFLPSLLRRGFEPRLNTIQSWRITRAGLAMLKANIGNRAPRQHALLNYLMQYPEGVSADALKREFPRSSAVLRILLNRGWIEKIFSSPSEIVFRPDHLPQLNQSQDQAVKAVNEILGDFQVFLLEGVTGSGKTEVYLRIVEAALNQQRQALILVPEIGLTPQLIARFQGRFSTPLVVLHSGLGQRERLNAWLLAREGDARVILGTRSAIFAPLKNPGIIIVDEEHDGSFKQQEGFRYSARDLAVVRARQLAIPVLLGSATPSLESLYNVQRGRYRHLSLPQRVGDAVEPPIRILDVRRQVMEEGLSMPLLARIRNHIEQDEQVLLFLNRRGFAPTLICHECGWLSQCLRCDARMTLHLRRRRMMCHHCGVERPVTKACPECGSIDLRALGQGTERIEQVLKREFPDIGIVRIDRDTTRRKGSLDSLLEDIHSGGRRILLGTQMLAKGHHFPDVTLVGIIDVDQGLFGIDFRASERMAQLILQVAGRAGRATKPGVVVIQTHHPGHPLLQTLVSQGYSAFAASALAERQAADLPPFSFQALLRAEAANLDLPGAFLGEARRIAEPLAQAVELLGPVPAPMERRAGRYRAQLLVQARQRPVLHHFLESWVPRFENLGLARRVRWSLDVDPVDLL